MRTHSIRDITRAAQRLRQRGHQQIEVERKFAPTAEFLREWKSLLGRDTSGPTGAAKAVIGAHELSIHDSYYELDNHLWSKGIWIRFRSHGPCQDQELEPDGWNVKLRLNGDFANSRMMELHGEQAVKDILEKHAPGAGISDLSAYAEFATMRQTWELLVPSSGYHCDRNWRMNLVLDTAASPKDERSGQTSSVFHHEVGEVELTKDVFGDGTGVSPAVEAEKMDTYLQRFMENNPSLFDHERRVIGKLEAFIQWKTGKT